MVGLQIIAVFVLLFFSGKTEAQRLNSRDSIRINLNIPEYRDPKKATILSAILPGAGQVYNNKAWKVPIIYGGFAANIYFIDFNNRRYQLFLENLRKFDRREPNDFPNLNREGLVRNVNFWRRNRDLNYFLFVGIYALNILDAHIDAQLSTFNINDDLALHFEPTMESLTAGGNLIGVSMKLKF